MFSMTSNSDEYAHYHQPNQWAISRTFDHPVHEYLDYYVAKTISRQGQRSSCLERTIKAKSENKLSGSYKSYTSKEKTTIGKIFKGLLGCSSGSKNEYKKTSTLKVGDPNGYTEYYTEHKVKTVEYDKKKNYGTSSFDNGYYHDNLHNGNGNSANRLNYGSRSIDNDYYHDYCHNGNSANRQLEYGSQCTCPKYRFEYGSSSTNNGYYSCTCPQCNYY